MKTWEVKFTVTGSDRDEWVSSIHGTHMVLGGISVPGDAEITDTTPRQQGIYMCEHYTYALYWDGNRWWEWNCAGEFTDYPDDDRFDEERLHYVGPKPDAL